MYREQWWGGVVILACVTIALLSVAGGLTIVIPASEFSKTAQIIQAFVASFVLLSGGLFAAIRLEIFRSFIPHITINQEVTHRTISDEYVHLLVTATLQNSSKVAIRFLQGYFRIQMLGPYPDDTVENIYREVFPGEDPNKRRYFQWTTLDEKSLNWNWNELIIEPGGVHQETCEFIVTSGVNSVLAYSYFYNSRRPFNPEGWGATTAHDIIGTNQDLKVLYE